MTRGGKKWQNKKTWQLTPRLDKTLVPDMGSESWMSGKAEQKAI